MNYLVPSFPFFPFPAELVILRGEEGRGEEPRKEKGSPLTIEKGEVRDSVIDAALSHSAGVPSLLSETHLRH